MSRWEGVGSDLRPWAVLFTAVPSVAQAHSFGQSYTLPIPLSFYAWSAAGALLLSFLIAAWFLRVGTRREIRSRTWPLTPGPARGLLMGLRCLSVLMLGLAMLSGLIGHPNSNVNISMTLFWIVFVLGFSYLSAGIGGLFAVINPWQTLSLLAERRLPRRWRAPLRYPVEGLAYWPAVVLYLGFIWLELFGNTRPHSLGGWLLGYSVFTLVGSLTFGARSWFRYVELFSVFLRLISLMAPLRLERSGSGSQWRWRLQWPFAGLYGRAPEHISLAVFVVCTLATTAYDGFHETVPWMKFYWSSLIPTLDPDIGPLALFKYQPWFWRWQWFGLLLAPLAYFGAYALAVWLGRLLSGSGQAMPLLLLRFSYSLIPISLVYHMAHYYTLIQTGGLRIVPLLSDPLGWGWNLFGTADWLQFAIVPQTGTTWHVQVALIILGHVAGVILAHREALRLFSTRRQAALSQLPMLALMVLYTSVGLWILSLPIQTARYL